MDLKYRFKVNEQNCPFLKKIFGGDVPTNQFFGGKNGCPVFICVPWQKVHHHAECMDLEEWGGVLKFEGRLVHFDLDLHSARPIKIPARINHAGHRTRSLNSLEGSKSRRPKHNWTKKRKARMNQGIWT